MQDVSPVRKVAVIGGGAAGFFAAIECAQANSQVSVSLFERSSRFLTKVRISGGGRCNVTHACFDRRMFTDSYPRGRRALLSALHRFSAEDTVAWFAERNVTLKREADGRMFPTTDSSATIVDCLLHTARAQGVQLFAGTPVDRVRVDPAGDFILELGNGETYLCQRLLLATGGCRDASGIRLANSLGHKVIPPIPSLFSLHVSAPWIRALPGVSMDNVELSGPGMKLREHGALLITHNGLSGPGVLRFSAWGARILHDRSYQFTLRVNWLPAMTEADMREELESRRRLQPNRHISNSPITPVPARLWEQLVLSSGISGDTTWGSLTRACANELVAQLRATELEVNGKSLNKDEFVTCGGVSLREIDFTTMESRITPGLYFAGEVIDIDGLTGGFNFQSAWTTGWIAGRAMAGIESVRA